MKKILFVVLPYMQDKEKKSSTKHRGFVAFPYGVLSIATYLKKNSDAVIKIFDCNIHDNFTEELLVFNPDIVALSMMFDNSYKYVKELAHQVNDWNSNALVVMGGAATRGSHKEILDEQPDIHAVCFGEGEIPFLKLITLNPSSAWVSRDTLRDGTVPEKEVIEDLDEVIELDYSFLNIDDYQMQESFSPFIRGEGKQFFVITSRGCPFKCTFCMNSSNNDKHIRYASVTKVIHHIRELVEKYGMTILTFYDDQLLFDKDRAKLLFRELAQFKLRIDCPNGLSVAFIDDELAYLMRKAGMDTVKLAIESGSPYVLKELMHKPLRVEMVKPVVEILHKHGFWVNGYFVTGMPGETDAHRKETLNLIKDAGIDWAGFCPAIPFRDTILYNQCLEKGYIKKIPLGESNTGDYTLNIPGTTSEYIAKQTYLMNLDVNFVNNRTVKIGEYEQGIRIFSQVLERYTDHAFAYYFIAKCATELFKQKTNKSNEWKEYAEYFGMTQRNKTLELIK
jgi:anaerobic magnesium-protoporphyrin IX monomethyl ester cyclase